MFSIALTGIVVRVRDRRGAAALLAVAIVAVAVLAGVLLMPGSDQPDVDPAALLAASRGQPTIEPEASVTDEPGTPENEVAGIVVTPTAPARTDQTDTTGTTSTAAPEPTAAQATAVTERIISVAFSGDILTHMPVASQARANATNAGVEAEYDFAPMFDDVRAELSSVDLALCSLETPLSTSNGRITGFPTFYAPREVADAVADAGFDGCALASNHSIDQDVAGVRSTLNQLERVGLIGAGTARTQQEQSTPVIHDVGGVRVAHLSWTYGLNGLLLPEGEEWWVNVTDEARIIAEAETARAAGADVVVLSIHWGAEYQTAPTPEQLGQADLLTSSGAIDLIVGNHAHVVQPIAVINDVPVVFGTGNFLSNQSESCCRLGTQDGVIIVIEFMQRSNGSWGVHAIAPVPTWVDRSDYTIVHIPDALDDPALGDDRRALLQASFDRTWDALLSLNFTPDTLLGD